MCKERLARQWMTEITQTYCRLKLLWMIYGLGVTVCIKEKWWWAAYRKEGSKGNMGGDNKRYKATTRQANIEWSNTIVTIFDFPLWKTQVYLISSHLDGGGWKGGNIRKETTMKPSTLNSMDGSSKDNPCVDNNTYAWRHKEWLNAQISIVPCLFFENETTTFEYQSPKFLSSLFEITSLVSFLISFFLVVVSS